MNSNTQGNLLGKEYIGILNLKAVDKGCGLTGLIKYFYLVQAGTEIQVQNPQRAWTPDYHYCTEENLFLQVNYSTLTRSLFCSKKNTAETLVGF